jgi:hypothetical protein
MADRAATARLTGLAVLLLSLGLMHAAPAPAGATDVAVQFVTAANRGDYRTVCHLYSARYLRSQASCRSLYRWGAGLYGPYDYKIVRWRALQNGHRRVDLTLRRHSSFIELEHEKAGWRIVAGGW